MKNLLLVALLYSQTTFSKEFTLFTYAKPGTMTSSSISSLIGELAETNPSVKVIESTAQVGLFSGGRYALMRKYHVPEMKKLDAEFAESQKNMSEVTMFETGRSFLLIHPKLPQELVREINKNAKNSKEKEWYDLSLSSAKFVDLGKDKYPFALVNETQWESDKNWHTISFYKMNIEYKGSTYQTYAIPKEFGSLHRARNFIKKKLGKAKNPLVIGTGNITRYSSKEKAHKVFSGLTVIGKQYLVLGVRDIIGAKWIRESGKNSFPEINFISANVFLKKNTEKGEGESYFFPSHYIVERDGIKIGILGVTDQHAQKVIDYQSVFRKELEQIVIKDPLSSIQKVLPELRKKVDIVILLSDLREEELGKIQHLLQGVDITLSRSKWRQTSAKEIIIKSNPFTKRRPKYPILDLESSRAHVNTVLFSYKDDELVAEVSEKILDQTIPYDATVNSVDDNYVQLHAAKNIVLPEQRKLYDHGKNLSDKELGHIAAEMMRRAAKAEVGIFNIQDSSYSGSGALDASAIRANIRSSERLVSFYLRGSDLNSFMASLGGLREPYTIAVSGVVDGKVNGIPIKSNEIYLVASSTAVTENLERYPSLQGMKDKEVKFKKINQQYLSNEEGSPQSIVDIVIEQLKLNWSETSKLPEEAKWQTFRDLYTGKGAKQGSNWVHEFKDIRLEYSKVNVGDVSSFSEISDSQIQSGDQESIGGKIDYSIFYRSNPYVLESGIRGEFSRVEIFKDGEDPVENITADDLVFFSQISLPIFPIKGLEILATRSGPFFELAYDTEFESSAEAPLEKVYRGVLGWNFLEGKYLQTSSIGVFGEFQRTFGREKEVTGLSAKLDWRMSFFEGRMNWKSQADLKYFFDANSDAASDLRKRYTWDNYLDYSILGGLSVGPYFKYFIFSGKTFSKTATQTEIGLSFSYSGQWKPAYQPYPM